VLLRAPPASFREAELCQGRLKLIFALQLLALLRGHVGFEKDFRRIILLREETSRRRKKRKNQKEKQPDSIH
jgi:hypothetical protein